MIFVTRPYFYLQLPPESWWSLASSWFLIFKQWRMKQTGESNHKICLGNLSFHEVIGTWMRIRTFQNRDYDRVLFLCWSTEYVNGSLLARTTQAQVLWSIWCLGKSESAQEEVSSGRMVPQFKEQMLESEYHRGGFCSSGISHHGTLPLADQPGRSAQDLASSRVQMRSNGCDIEFLIPWLLPLHITYLGAIAVAWTDGMMCNTGSSLSFANHTKRRGVWKWNITYVS